MLFVCSHLSSFYLFVFKVTNKNDYIYRSLAKNSLKSLKIQCHSTIPTILTPLAIRNGILVIGGKPEKILQIDQKTKEIWSTKLNKYDVSERVCDIYVMIKKLGF